MRRSTVRDASGGPAGSCWGAKPRKRGGFGVEVGFGVVSTIACGNVAVGGSPVTPLPQTEVCDAKCGLRSGRLPGLGRSRRWPIRQSTFALIGHSRSRAAFGSRKRPPPFASCASLRGTSVHLLCGRCSPDRLRTPHCAEEAQWVPSQPISSTHRPKKILLRNVHLFGVNSIAKRMQ